MGLFGSGRGQETETSKGGSFFSLKSLVVIVLLGIACYQVYLGVHLSEIGVPGLFTLKFQQTRTDGGQRAPVEPSRVDPEPVRPPIDPPPIPPDPPPLATRDFMVGQWEVRQDMGALGAGTVVTYFGDGTFAGVIVYFNGGFRTQQPIQGIWQFVPLDDSTFRVDWQSTLGEFGSEVFAIEDQDRIRNVLDNYTAFRVQP